MKMRELLLKKIHEDHWGIVRAKQLARRYCIWQGIDQDIEKMLKACAACAKNSKLTNRAYTSWPLTSFPFEHVHVEFCGPFKDYVWLILMDSYSKFPFAVKMNGISTFQTITALRSIFALEGIPKTHVSDNGTHFASLYLKEFCLALGINY